jgi:hypothetical protein
MTKDVQKRFHGFETFKLVYFFTSLDVGIKNEKGNELSITSRF